MVVKHLYLIKFVALITTSVYTYYMTIDALKKAIKTIGSQRRLSKNLGISSQRVNHWVNRDKKVPGEFCIAIEKLTKGKVTRFELRPDIFLPIKDG